VSKLLAAIAMFSLIAFSGSAFATNACHDSCARKCAGTKGGTCVLSCYNKHCQ
jgi:hypothetical protein